MVFMVSSMLSGACATPEFLMYLNYFIGKEYGTDYYLHAGKVVDLSKKQRTLDKVITDCFEQIVYSINQPTGARTTTNTISRVCSVISSSPTVKNPTGILSIGSNAVS